MIKKTIVIDQFLLFIFEQSLFMLFSSPNLGILFIKMKDYSDQTLFFLKSKISTEQH
jgi:hypothetical protein